MKLFNATFYEGRENTKKTFLSLPFLNLHERVQIDATKTRRSPPNLFLLVVNLADFFENQANEICSHLSDKASKGMFRVKPDELQNHSNEGN